MARFVNLHYPAQHGGVARIEQAVTTLRGYHAGQAMHVMLHALALIGSPVVLVAARVRAALAASAAARRQRAEDRKLWDLALTDARVMADLSRAMSQDALRDGSRYF
jgi:hypothetical protein